MHVHPRENSTYMTFKATDYDQESARTILDLHQARKSFFFFLYSHARSSDVNDNPLHAALRMHSFLDAVGRILKWA